MVSVKLQVIQKYLLEKKPEESPTSAKDILLRIINSRKLTPVLKNKGCYSRKNKSELRANETSSKKFSPRRPVSIYLDSVKNPQYCYKKPEISLFSSYNSFDILQKSAPDTPKLGQKIETDHISIKTPPHKSKRDQKKPKQKIVSKSDIDKLWRRTLNLSNGIEVSSGPPNFKVFIGPGNNSYLVKRLMANRFWWKIVDQMQDAHFVWTQWKDDQYIQSLPCFSQLVEVNPDQKLPPWPTVSKNFWAKTKTQGPEYFGLNLIQKSKSYRILNSQKLESADLKLYNRLEFNECLSNKKGLYETMRIYYESSGQQILNQLPLTYVITNEQDPIFSDFLEKFMELEQNKSKQTSFHNIWIVKPGENSNRGNGIQVVNTLEGIKHSIKPESGKSYIIQKYIENPLLINKRKFDIRCYAMITSINGVIQGYFYQEGYLRTASYEYTIEDTSNNFIHLTNDAIQKHSTSYGKYENANKLSYKEFQRYLDMKHPEQNFSQRILPKIKILVKDTILASYLQINKNRRMNCFEVFGYDFMIDSEFKPWLIEVNTNPCLELASLTLRILIPAMLENALKLVIDSLFPAPGVQHQQGIQLNKFELIFHQDEFKL